MGCASVVPYRLNEPSERASESLNAPPAPPAEGPCGDSFCPVRIRAGNQPAAPPGQPPCRGRPSADPPRPPCRGSKVHGCNSAPADPNKRFSPRERAELEKKFCERVVTPRPVRRP